MTTESLEAILAREITVRRRQRVYLGSFLIAVAVVLTSLVSM